MRGVMRVVTALLLLAAVSQMTNAGKILAVFPFPAPSHLIVMNSLVNELAAKGHEVTVITAIPQKNAHKNIKQIDIKIEMADMMGGHKMNLFEMGEMNIIAKTFMLFGFGKMICEVVLSKPHIQEFIKTPNKYDAVIGESFFNECMLGFAHTFQAPIIQVCPFGGTEWMGNAVGNPHSYAYIPDFQLNYGTHMTFFQRLHNTVVGLFVKLTRNVYYLPTQNSMLQKYFAGTNAKPLPHITDLEQTTSLLLLNNHVSLSHSRPYMPNIVEVGGMHIKPPKQLPEDLQQFLDSAKEGVVYFSMGSNLRGADLPAAKRDAFLQAFASLKQKVLWKWEDDTLPGQPKNVKLGKWLPQSDLLAHPNVKMFITHGGLLSTQESVYNGKPVVGIPIFGDQMMNMNQAVHAGYGYLLPFSNITSESVAQAVNAVLTIPKYAENAARISRIFRDQPRTPLETAVFWTEYVIRHKGAHHMRSAALDLTWYQYYLLDVLAVLGGGALLVITVLFLTLRAAIKCCLPKNKALAKNKDKKKKSN